MIVLSVFVPGAVVVDTRISCFGFRFVIYVLCFVVFVLIRVYGVH